ATDFLNRNYIAPECLGEMGDVKTASDVFSAGLIIYEMVTGEKPFDSPTELVDRGSVFKTPPSVGGIKVRHDLPIGFDEWLQSLCRFNWSERPTAHDALASLERLLDMSEESSSTATPQPQDYSNLPTGTLLDGIYQAQERLGKPGAFGIAYKVIDTFG